MRKRLKRKKRSCTLCKPHKMSASLRWKDREQMLLREFEKDYR